MTYDTTRGRSSERNENNIVQSTDVSSAEQDSIEM